MLLPDPVSQSQIEMWRDPDDDFDDRTAEASDSSVKSPGSPSSACESHSRVIVHVDADCFYAQVETLKNPAIADSPIVVKQENIVATANYAARRMGVPKMGFVADLESKFPGLVVVNGEDLADYRKYSKNVHEIIVGLGLGPVERLGMDENFIDVTSAVQDRIHKGTVINEGDNTLISFADGKRISFVGHVYGSKCLRTDCPCDCSSRLAIGSLLASEIRQTIRSKLGLTLSAGVAHNKVLAKMVGGAHKPNDQTSLLPHDAGELLASRSEATGIPGIGHAMGKILKEHDVVSVADLQRVDVADLSRILDGDTAKRVKDLSFGIDPTPVKQSGKAHSIGLEDSFKQMSLRSECEDKLRWLLGRLCKLISEDGRTPRVLKVSSHDRVKSGRTFSRETRQCKVSPSLFAGLRTSDGLDERTTDEVMRTAMALLDKMVDFKQPVHLSVLGISVSDFQDPAPSDTKSIVAFFKEGAAKRKKSEDCVGGGDAAEPKKPRSPDGQDIDPEIFSQLPPELQAEIMAERKGVAFACAPERRRIGIPGDWDPEVFESLPAELKKEMLASQSANSNGPKKKPAAAKGILSYFSKK